MMNNEANESIQNSAPAVTGIGAGLNPNDPAANERINDIMKMRGTDYLRAGIGGAAAGSQVGQGAANPLSAFVQGMAAGMQAPAQIYAQKQAQVKSVIGATPFGITHPEVSKTPGYEILSGLPTDLALEVIKTAASDGIKQHIAGQEARITAGLRTDEHVPVIDENYTTQVSDVMEKAPGELASQYGLPAERRNPYYKMPQKAFEKVKAANSTLAIKDLGKLQDAASNMDNVVNSLQRAKTLLDSGLQTGPISGRIPGRKFGQDAQEFEQIASTILPSMRSGMPGAVSDRDMAIFREANFGLAKDEEVNRKVINQHLAIATRVKDKAEFMANWATVYGDMAGADAEWSKYIRENPMFTIKGDINPHLVTYQKFFDTKSGRNASEWTPEKEAKLQELRAKAGK